MSKRLLENYKGKFFKPKYKRSQKDLTSYIQEGSKKDFKISNIANTNFESTSSFRYESNMPVKSTQQLNIDYSNFENHTFFHSAVAKVNESFLNILNYYPFNGTEKQIEAFEDSLTGLLFTMLLSHCFPVSFLKLEVFICLKGSRRRFPFQISACRHYFSPWR